MLKNACAYKSFEQVNVDFPFEVFCFKMPPSTIFQLYRGGHFIGGGNGVPEENYRPVVSHSQTVSHNVVSSTPRMNRI